MFTSLLFCTECFVAVKVAVLSAASVSSRESRVDFITRYSRLFYDKALRRYSPEIRTLHYSTTSQVLIIIKEDIILNMVVNI